MGTDSDSDSDAGHQGDSPEPWSAQSCKAPPPPPDVPLPSRDDPVDRLRYAARCLRYSVRTERSYAFWVGRFLAYCSDGGVDQDAGAVRAFLERFVVAEQVSTATQAQALNALPFPSSTS